MNAVRYRLECCRADAEGQGIGSHRDPVSAHCADKEERFQRNFAGVLTVSGLFAGVAGF